jgi:hypothetical protein
MNPPSTRATRALLPFTVLMLVACNASPSPSQQDAPAEQPAATPSEQSSVAEAVPVIASDEPVFEFGTVAPDGQVKHVFKLVNRGSADLHIERVERT